jgi:hypothetical protein
VQRICTDDTCPFSPSIVEHCASGRSGKKYLLNGRGRSDGWRFLPIQGDRSMKVSNSAGDPAVIVPTYSLLPQLSPPLILMPQLFSFVTLLPLPPLSLSLLSQQESEKPAAPVPVVVLSPIV